MKPLLALLFFIAAAMSGAASGQDWTVYTPPEGDFRVLFPAPPVRLTEKDGSAAFRAGVENSDYAVQYTVYRVPAGFQSTGNPQADLRMRLGARATNEDQSITNITEEDDEPTWERYVFRRDRRGMSVNRLVGTPGRYYELEVYIPRGPQHIAVQTARDFFNSFQATGFALLPSAMAAISQTLDNWCQKRTDPFSAAFCKFSVCLLPGHEKYPHCSSLRGR
jgi:hypothetical protein